MGFPMTKKATSVSNSITLRVELPNVAGSFAKVATAIGKAGGVLGAIDLVSAANNVKVRDITVDTSSEDHARKIVDAVGKVPGVKVLNVSDRVFLLHLGGKISVENKIPVTNRQYLSIAYTPGVARVCRAIAEDLDRAYTLTIKKNTVAIVSDGTAILGLGDLGPEAAMPVMEGKAMLFKEFGGVDAFPLCVASKEVEDIIQFCKMIAPTFGGINLEDISAPRCFEIEERLKKEIDIPVFHDDQHGTAVVVLAALLNALKIVNKPIGKIRMVILGIGAAGVACTKLLKKAGVRDIIGLDRAGIIYKGRTEHMNSVKEWFAENTNPERIQGDIVRASEGADVFLGLSGPNLFPEKALRKMAKDAIVFSLANPDPEIDPEIAHKYARIVATGRSDYPNQINNVLCFPGLFRGTLDCRAREINDAMKMAAAKALSAVVAPKELSEEYIIPSVFNRKVLEVVSKAVAREALRTGVARRHRLARKAHYF
jgi:malate dehydrogenase (oxaloacetate-decarboxylating)